MQDMTGNAWTWPQLGNPSVPLKYEMKSLENDIKNAGIGVTVWKWQAIQK